MPPLGTRKPSEHGTRSRYQQGCRCDPCKGANAADQRASRARDKAKPGKPARRRRGKPAAVTTAAPARVRRKAKPAARAAERPAAPDSPSALQWEIPITCDNGHAEIRWFVIAKAGERIPCPQCGNIDIVPSERELIYEYGFAPYLADDEGMSMAEFAQKLTGNFYKPASVAQSPPVIPPASAPPMPPAIKKTSFPVNRSGSKPGYKFNADWRGHGYCQVSLTDESPCRAMAHNLFLFCGHPVCAPHYGILTLHYPQQCTRRKVTY